eukprot:3038645-Pyramimonas_sp.AAC.1
MSAAAAPASRPPPRRRLRRITGRLQRPQRLRGRFFRPCNLPREGPEIRRTHMFTAFVISVFAPSSTTSGPPKTSPHARPETR